VERLVWSLHWQSSICVGMQIWASGFYKSHLSKCTLCITISGCWLQEPYTDAWNKSCFLSLSRKFCKIRCIKFKNCQEAVFQNGCCVNTPASHTQVRWLPKSKVLKHVYYDLHKGWTYVLPKREDRILGNKLSKPRFNIFKTVSNWSTEKTSLNWYFSAR